MRFTFIFHDVQEISSNAFCAFISTFKYESEEFDSYSNSDNSDSDLSYFEPDIFGCGEITSEVKSIAENTWEIFNPLD